MKGVCLQKLSSYSTKPLQLFDSMETLQTSFLNITPSPQDIQLQRTIIQKQKQNESTNGY